MINTLRVAYPESRTFASQVFRPVVNPRTYLRAVHLFAMFPLGIAYFVSLVTLLALGGSLIWTFPGALLVLFTIFGSRLVGDLESVVVGKVSNIEIKRPPWRTEGAEGWRSRLWVRLIDPTTWTGIVYLFVQFPLGIAAFVSLIVSFSISGALIASPVIIHFTGDPFELDFVGWSLIVDRPVEAIWLVPVGLVALLLTVHLVTVFSVLHATWAKFMLGSKAKTVQNPMLPPGTPEPPTPGKSESADRGGNSPLPTAPASVRPFGSFAVEGGTARNEILSPNAGTGAADRVAPIIPFREDSLPDDLTQREREVLLLLARGLTNAEIAEECFISQGTVKTHVKRILAKLQLNDRTQVVVFAYETGLVTPEPGRTSRSVVSS